MRRWPNPRSRRVCSISAVWSCRQIRPPISPNSSPQIPKNGSRSLSLPISSLSDCRPNEQSGEGTMTIARRKLLHLGFGAAAAASVVRTAAALDYPTRPITIVVPFAAGGATDVLARVIADAMGKSLGQTMIVENVTGAAGSIGVSRVARAPSDGYTLSIGTLTSHVLVGGLYKLDFDLLADLTPISELAYE